MNKQTALLLALVGCVAGLPVPTAHADVLYTVTSVDAVAPTPVGQTWTDISSTLAPANALDTGGFDITLPFGFTFYGQAYTAVRATVDGLLIFGTTTCGGSTSAVAECYGGGFTNPVRRLPDARGATHNFIAFWMADMRFPSATGIAATSLTGTAPNQTFSIKYTNWAEKSGSTNVSPRTVQIDLHETSGIVDVYYGDLGAPAAGSSAATVGVENADGTRGSPGLECSNYGTNASTPSRCSLKDWPAQSTATQPKPPQRIRYDPTVTNRPDLVVRDAVYTNVVPDGTGFKVTLRTTIENLGPVEVNDVRLTVYLVTGTGTGLNTNPPPWSTLLTTSLVQSIGKEPASEGIFFGAPAKLDGYEIATREIEVPVAQLTGTAPLFFVVQVDQTTATLPNGRVTEACETNNWFVPSGAAKLRNGKNISVLSVDYPNVVEGEKYTFGEAIRMRFVIKNTGTQAVVVGEDEFGTKGEAVPKALYAQQADLKAPASGGWGPANLFWAYSSQQTISAWPLKTLQPGEEQQFEANFRFREKLSLPNKSLVYAGIRIEWSGAADVDAADDVGSKSITLYYIKMTMSGFEIRSAIDEQPTSEIYFDSEVYLDWTLTNPADTQANPVPPVRGFFINAYISQVDTLAVSSGGDTYKITCQEVELERPTLQPGETITYRELCTLPRTKKVLKDGVLVDEPLPDSTMVENLGNKWYAGVKVDSGESYPRDPSESAPTGVPAWNVRSKPVQIFHPAMNLVANYVGVQPNVAAGAVIYVQRGIGNTGIIGNGLPKAPDYFEYTYYLSTDRWLDKLDTALPVIVGTVEQLPALGSLGPMGTSEAVETIRIPAYVSPGDYYLGIMLNPNREQTLKEIRYDDNSALTLGTIRVAASGVAITTSYLPDALFGLPYTQQLMAVGGGEFEWTLLTGNDPLVTGLPSGLSLSPSGLIHGTPAARGTFVVYLGATSLERTATARFLLRVIDSTGPMQLVTRQLKTALYSNYYPPPDTSKLDYDDQLLADGGMPFIANNGKPYYVWTLIDGTLPEGLELSTDGAITGSITGNIDSPKTLTLTVTAVDARNNSVTGDVSLSLASLDEPFYIDSIKENNQSGKKALPSGTVGVEYRGVSIVVVPTPVDPTDPTVAFSIVWGELPPGMRLGETGSSAGVFSGTPTQEGVYNFVVRAAQMIVLEDLSEVPLGPTDMRQFSLFIAPRGDTSTDVRFNPEPIADLTIGDMVNIDISRFATGPEGLEFSQRSGRLPPGLELRTNGWIVGQIPFDDSVLGRYNFTVGIRAPNGDTGEYPMSLNVAPVPSFPMQETTSGCSSVGGNPAWLALLASLALPMALRRRRTAVAAVAALALGATSAQARTLAASDYTATGPYVKPFEPIVGTPVAFTGSSPNYVGELTLPFLIRMWDKEYKRVRVGCRGYLALEVADSNNWNATISTGSNIPWTAYKSPVIAPWWGPWMCDQGSVTWTTVGNAPYRTVVFQWNVYQLIQGSSYGATFQAHIQETTGKIDFVYGPASLKDGAASTTYASTGIGMGDTAGVVGLSHTSCTVKGTAGKTAATCTFEDFHPDHAATYQQKADVRLVDIYSEPVGYAGTPMRMGATFANDGGMDITGNRSVSVSYKLSFNTVEANGIDLGESPKMSLAAGQMREALMAPQLLWPLSPGTWYLFATVKLNDESNPPNFTFSDLDATNHKPSGPLAIQIKAPAPDFAPGAVSFSGTVAPSATLTVTAQVLNLGRLASDGPVNGRVTLSPTPETSLIDRVLCGFTVTERLPEYTTDDGAVPVEAACTATLPSDLKPGTYYLGLIVNPFDDPARLDEVTVLNNASTQGLPISYVSSALRLREEALPHAVTSSAYSAAVRAEGGDGAYTYELMSGIDSLPDGIEFSSNGLLHGMTIDTRPEGFPFRVRVTSGAAQATGDFTLFVDFQGAPLTIVTKELPLGSCSEPYSVVMRAIGGTAPYRWSTFSVLPTGLALTPGGLLTGMIAAGDGKYTLDVTVTDASEEKVSITQRLTLVVDTPGNFRIANVALPYGEVNVPYAPQKISVAGSYGPTVFKWGPNTAPAFDSIKKVTIGDSGQLVLKDSLLPGMTLEDGGDPNHTFVVFGGQPNEPGTYILNLTVWQDPSLLNGGFGPNDFATASFVWSVLESGEGLAFTTLQLPDAIVGRPYTATLQTNRQDNKNLTFSCFRYVGAGDNVCFPDAFRLQENGTFMTTTGDGLVPDLVGADEPHYKDYTFMVLAKSSNPAGRFAIGSYTIRVRKDAPLPPAAAGCSVVGASSTTGVAFVVFAMALALVGVGHRRKEKMKMPRLGKLGLLAAVPLFVAGCQSQSMVHDKCWKVQCDEPLTCDANDGLCKCGGFPDAAGRFKGGTLCGEGVCTRAGICEYECAGSTVDCDPGMTLDRGDCTCKCGGVGGQICEPGERCDSALRACFAVDQCGFTQCDPGFTCDPRDGVCKCGGLECAEGQSCVGGGCSNNPCGGVNCTENGGVCDPTTRACVCNGTTCAKGESCGCPLDKSDCAASEVQCVETDLCIDVVCPDGLTCNPLDGECKCGGPPGTICMEDQTCDQVRGICIGGRLCLNKVCARTGFTCDPRDGKCKCGGESDSGGVECGAREECGKWETISGPAWACVQPCTMPPDYQHPLDNNTCPRLENGVQQYCFWDKDLPLGLLKDEFGHQQGYCMTPGENAADGTAVRSGCAFYRNMLIQDCKPGYYCRPIQESTAGICYRLCGDQGHCGTQGGVPEQCVAVDGSLSGPGEDPPKACKPPG